jgi:predicted RNase H-like HicB family nuclease
MASPLLCRFDAWMLSNATSSTSVFSTSRTGPNRACAFPFSSYLGGMKIKVLVHEAEEGGFWADVPALPGCVSQGETMDELIANVREAVTGWLDAEMPEPGARERVVELAL